MTPIIVDYTVVDLSGLAGSIPSNDATVRDIDRQLKLQYPIVIAREPRMMSAMWLITGLTVGIEWSIKWSRIGGSCTMSGLVIAR